MNETENWQKAVSFAYATSITANKLGYGSSGCYYVALERPMGEGRIESREISGHNTLEGAKRAAEAIAFPQSKFSL